MNNKPPEKKQIALIDISFNNCFQFLKEPLKEFCNQGKGYADKQTGGKWEIKGEGFSLNSNIAWQFT